MDYILKDAEASPSKSPYMPKVEIDNFLAETKGMSSEAKYEQYVNYLEEKGIKVDIRASVDDVNKAISAVYADSHHFAAKQIRDEYDPKIREYVAKAVQEADVLGIVDEAQKLVVLKYRTADSMDGYSQDAYAIVKIGESRCPEADDRQGEDACYRATTFLEVDPKFAIMMIESLPNENRNEIVNIRPYKIVITEQNSGKSYTDYDFYLNFGDDGIIDMDGKLYTSPEPVTSAVKKEMVYELIEKPQKINQLQAKIEELRDNGKIKEALEVSKKLNELKKSKDKQPAKASREDKETR